MKIIKTLLFVFTLFASFFSLADYWGDLNKTVEGSYSIKDKETGKENFKLEVKNNRVKASYGQGPKEVFGKMGDLILTSKKYGVCKGAYQLVEDDDTFDKPFIVIEAPRGLRCDRLSSPIEFYFAFPDKIQLNSVKSVDGGLMIRHKGNVLYEEEVVISPVPSK